MILAAVLASFTDIGIGASLANIVLALSLEYTQNRIQI